MVLTKRYGDKVAVDALSFSVQPGLVTGSLGPNGAGKSTTMRMLLGLDRPSSGTATINGRSYERLRAPLCEVGALLDRAELTNALDAIWLRVRRLNRYVEEQAPWQLARDPDNSEALDKTLASLVEGIRTVNVMLEPYMPESTARLREALGSPGGAVSPLEPPRMTTLPEENFVESAPRRGISRMTAPPISPASALTGAPRGIPMSITSTVPEWLLPGAIHSPGLAAWKDSSRVRAARAQPRSGSGVSRR